MDIYDYSRKAFPKLVAEKLQQMKRLDTSATYEMALQRVAKENGDLYESYCHAVGR